MFFRKKRKACKEELKKNEGAILKFVNIASEFGRHFTKQDARVSSANTSKSIPEVKEETNSGQMYLSWSTHDVLHVKNL